jgi:hypothetical protein
MVFVVVALLAVAAVALVVHARHGVGRTSAGIERDESDRAAGRVDAPSLRAAEVGLLNEEPAPATRQDVLRAWQGRARRVPDASRAGVVTLPMRYVRPQEGALLAAYTRWSEEPPPAGAWIEIVRPGGIDSSGGIVMGTSWPTNVNGLWWRPAPGPTPGGIVVPEAAPTRDDGDLTPSR